MFASGDDDSFAVDAADINQGSIGDCWLIAAISGVSAHFAKVAKQEEETDEPRALPSSSPLHS